METHSLDVSMPAISWPALSFSQGLIYLGYSLETETTRLGLKKRFFDGMLLVDSAGREFRVAGAEKVRMLPPRKKWLVGDLLGLLTGNPRYAVRLRLAVEEPRLLQASEVKAMVFRAISGEASWEAMVDLDDFKADLARAGGIGDVFRICNEYHL